MLFLTFILGTKIASSAVAEERATALKSIPFWLISIILIATLHYIMLYIFNINQEIIDKAREMGKDLSGINSQDLDDEVTLYESALSKAYELQFTSGTIGMFLYMILVFFTYKFVIVYAKRFFNVMILILSGPMVCAISAFKRVVFGTPGTIVKWFKEFIYNVMLQSVHALAYASLIGLTIKLCEEQESFFGAILTMLMFTFIFSIDRFIRRLFNIVGGKSIVKQRDIIGGVKEIGKGGAKLLQSDGTMGEKLGNMFDNKKNEIAQKLNPEALTEQAVKFKNDTINKTKEAIDSLDGSKIKLTDKELKKAKEAIENPSVIRKASKKIKNVTEKINQKVLAFSNTFNKKVSERVDNIKNLMTEDIEHFNQNVEMAKRLKSLVLKHDVVNKKPEENDDVNLNTVIDLAKTGKEKALELKDRIKNAGSDLIAIVYETEGPQAFIYLKHGFSYLGISVLASEQYAKKYLEGEKTDEPKRTIHSPVKNEIMDEDEEDKKLLIIKKKRKVYKFVRFNGNSVRTITHGLNRRIVLNSKYLTRMLIISGNMNLGNLVFRGFPKGVNKTVLRYKGKYNSARKMKENADLELEKYEERVQDSKWATLNAVSLDVKKLRNNLVTLELEKVKKASNKQIAVSQLEDMGMATRLNEKSIIVFGKSIQSINEMTNSGSEENEEKSEQIDETTDEVEKMQMLTQVVEKAYSRAVARQKLVHFGMDSEFENMNIASNEKVKRKSVATNEDVIGGKVVSNEVSLNGVTFSNESGNKVQFQEKKENEEVSSAEVITNSIIIKTAMNFEYANIQELDLHDEDVRNEVLDDLIQKGIVGVNVKEDEEAQIEILDSMEEIKSQITQREYLDSAMQEEITRIAQETGISETEEIENLDVNNHMSKLSKLVKNIAKETVKIEANMFKETMKLQAEAANEVVKDEKEKLDEEVNFVREMIREEVQFAKDIGKQNENLEGEKEEVALPSKAKEKLKKVVKKVATPFGDDEQEGQNWKDKYNTGDIFTVQVMGAVLYEGTYKLPIGSRVFQAIQLAGGPTEDADLTSIPYYEPVRDGETIRIPSRHDDQDFEEMIDASKPVIEEEVKKYMIENNISNPEALRKLVHKNMLITQIRKVLKNDKLTKRILGQLIEVRIKEILTIRESFNDVKKDAKVVKEQDIEPKEEEIDDERERQIKAVQNTQEYELNNMIHGIATGQDTEVSQENEELKKLLETMKQEGEKVLVGRTSGVKREMRQRYIDDTPEDKMNRLLGRL